VIVIEAHLLSKRADGELSRMRVEWVKVKAGLLQEDDTVEIPVFVEALPDGRGFRAKASEPFDVAAESKDRSIAIAEVKGKLEALVANGSIVPVIIGQKHPAMSLIGTIEMSDPRAQQWWQYVEEFRREMDHIVLPGESVEDAQ
jgi:hypothetical protein